MVGLKAALQELKREEQVCRQGRHQGIRSVGTAEGPGWKLGCAGHLSGHGWGWMGERPGS